MFQTVVKVNSFYFEYIREILNKKLIFILLFMGCGVFEQFYKPKILIDVNASNFSKFVLNQMNQDLIQKFDLKYLNDGDCTENLIQKKVDACISTVPFSAEDSLKFEDNSLNPSQTLLGADGVIAVVHNTNTVEILEEQQLKGIFDGSYQFWDEVGGFSPQIISYIQDNSIGKLFNDLVLKGEDYFDLSINVENTDSMIVSILDDFNGIGFVRASEIFKVILKIKMISIAYPDEELIAVPLFKNILSGEYPFAFQFYYQTIENGKEKVKELKSSITNKSTQKIIKDSGFIPANNK